MLGTALKESCERATKSKSGSQPVSRLEPRTSAPRHLPRTTRPLRQCATLRSIRRLPIFHSWPAAQGTWAGASTKGRRRIVALAIFVAKRRALTRYIRTTQATTAGSQPRETPCLARPRVPDSPSPIRCLSVRPAVILTYSYSCTKVVQFHGRP